MLEALGLTLVVVRFIAGTSSTLFNQAFLRLNESNADGLLVNAIQR